MKKYIFSIATLCFAISAYSQNISLEEAKKNALIHNERIKNSALEVEEATAFKKEAKNYAMPKVSALVFGMKAVDPLFKLNMEGGNLPVYDGNPANLLTATQFAYMPGINMSLLNQMAVGAVTVLQPVYAGNKIKTGNKLADINLDVKRKQSELSQREILFKTEKEYWQIVSLYKKQETLTGYENFLDKLTKEVQNAVKNGVTLKNDALKVQVKRSELKLKRIQLENGILLSTRQLSQTTGIPFTESLIASGIVSNINPPEFYFIDENTAIKQRLEYQMLEESIQASQLKTELQKGDARPSINVGLTGLYFDMLEKNTNGNFNGMAFASVSVPISSLWENKHKIDQLKTKEQIATNELQENAGLLALQIEKAWRDLNEAFTNISLNEEILEQSSENSRINQQSYKNGMSQMSDLLDAQAQVNDTEERLIESQIKYQVAVSNYLLVTGR